MWVEMCGQFWRGQAYSNGVECVNQMLGTVRLCDLVRECLGEGSSIGVPFGTLCSGRNRWQRSELGPTHNLHHER